MKGTLIERLRARAAVDPHAPLYTFLDDDGRDAGALDVADTVRHADAIAGFLHRSCGLGRGDRALLVYPPSLDFVKAFLGCLVAGVVPVPLPPPDPLRLAEDLARFAALAESSGAKVVLTNTKYAAMRAIGTVRNVLARPWRRWPDLPWHTTDRVRAGVHDERDAPPAPVPAPSETAFLQYTSGSTSRPKGVMITWGNLDHQLAANARDLRMTSRSKLVSWVPHFHDFGLISGILSVIHSHAQLVMFSPLAFVRRPALWLEVISRTRATHTAAPTFAYELAVRKTTPRDRAALDLSSVEVAMCAAEPIHARTVRRFVEAFASSGFRADAFCPAYGLAEHTVGVTIGGRGTLAVDRARLDAEGYVVPATGEDAKELVACGPVPSDTRVLIVDPTTLAVLPEGKVGEIWVDSPSKAGGYFDLPDETARTFCARVGGDAAEYLRTGDLGTLHGGQLYVTGRLKDVIIVRGRNLYPGDVEETIRDAHPLVRPGGVAAFSIEEIGADGVPEERLGLLVEVREKKVEAAKLVEVARTLRRLVLEEHQQACRAIVLAPPGAVPKTTSGKVMRSACRDAFARGELARAALHVDRGEAPAPIARAPQEEAKAATAMATEAPRPTVDPRREGLDEGFERLVAEVGARFRAMAQARKGRVFHKTATTLRGELVVLDMPAIPRHRFFAPGARYAAIVRHANGVQDDDAGCDNRGASVRLLPEGSRALDAPLLDLLLTTGSCFLAASARDFARWIGTDRAGREAIVREQPHVGAATWDMFRRPTSYARLHYHSKIASSFVAEDGARSFVRYRIVPADRAEDTGFVTPDAPFPPELVPREAGDDRSRTFLHEELASRLSAGPIAYLLQVQLRRAGASRADDEDALDCTRPWGEPWRDVATLTLRERVDEGEIEPLRFDPFHAPADLALPLARSAGENASLGHLRSLVYSMAADARLAAAPAPVAKPRKGRRVCVVGAGASGLAAAWALEREGHEVTVLERAPEVAGKCASFTIDDRVYDWGGHLCTAHYTSVAAMVDAIGIAKEPATPTLVFDLETRRVRARDESPRVHEELARYHAARARGFGEVTRPGLARIASSLAEPVSAWLRAEGLRSLGAAVGINYTACGYGHIDDEELAAVYLVKAAEMAGILSSGKGSGLPDAWTPAGGFGAFWQRVAAGLRDVRTGVAPLAIERRNDGVTVTTRDGVLAFDELIVASPLDEALAFLDATPEERDLFGRIRTLDYRTVACRARGLPEGGFYLVKQHCEDRRRVGHAVAFHHRYAGSDVYLFYVYGSQELGRAEVVARLREDVARMGGEIDEVIDERRFRYFPHASSRDLEGGFFDRLEALQGRRRTYFLGSLFNFELVECNVAYAHDLVARFFSSTPRAARAADSGVEGAAPLVEAIARAGSKPARAAILSDYLRRLFAEELALAELPLPEERFLDLGLDSVKSVEIFQRLASDMGGRALAPVLFFDHPTIAELADHLADELVSGGPARPRRGAEIGREAPRAGGARVIRTSGYTQIEDVVFADRHGVGLTLDVFAPTAPSNGLAVVDVASALWSSGRDVIVGHKVYGTYDAFCDRGFTVFAVRPGSASLFDGQEMAEHVREAVRWIKAHAREHGVDPLRVGMIGGSAGGHLACLAALVRGDGGKPGDRFDASVHALVAHCPMTRYREDELDPAYGALVQQLVAPKRGAPLLGDDERRLRHLALSPIVHVGASAPPTLVFHARGDKVVPFAASEAFVGAIQAAGGSAELVARDSDGHPWPGIEKDMIASAEWMEETLLRPATPPARGAWLRAVREVRSPSMRLVCFHHAGGSSAMFEAWADGLPGDVAILAVDLPGRGARAGEPACTDIEEALAAIEAELAPSAGEPYALFGHSLGAILAFELCRRLRRGGAPMPARLFVSGFVGPRAYDPSRALDARDVGPAFDRGGPGLEADFRLFRGWSYAPEGPLDVPITALGGASDPFAPAAGLDAWRDETTASFDRATLPGHHFYLLADPAPLVARLARDLSVMVGDARARSFASAWRARPHALEGSWNFFDLAWLGRPSGASASEPAFPEAIDALVALQREDGGVGPRSPEPYCNLVTSLAFANTLLRWNDGGRYTSAIALALDSALSEHLRAEGGPAAALDERARRPEGDRFFRFHGFFGRWLVPARECRELLARHGERLTAEQRRMAESYASATEVSFEANHDRFFDQDSLVLHFAEYFPPEAFASASARDHATRTSGLPALTAAGAARYFEITRDAQASARLREALGRPRDGLRPGGRVQELEFALAYLVRGGVDVRRFFAAELAELEGVLGPDGVGVEPGARVPDGDASAVAQIVCHALGIQTRMPTRRLEGFWDGERAAYASADGHATYTVSTTLHVLEAYLGAPDVTRDEQAAVWARTIRLLETRPWTELHHLSPLYVWEKIVAIVGAHAPRFPEAPTRVHEEALAQILASQDAGGGFRGALAAPTVEETALAVLALRSALAWPSRDDVRRALDRGRASLEKERARPAPHPELWVGKLLYTPVNLVEAILTAALAG